MANHEHFSPDPDEAFGQLMKGDRKMGIKGEEEKWNEQPRELELSKRAESEQPKEDDGEVLDAPKDLLDIKGLTPEQKRVMEGSIGNTFELIRQLIEHGDITNEDPASELFRLLYAYQEKLEMPESEKSDRNRKLELINLKAATAVINARTPEFNLDTNNDSIGTLIETLAEEDPQKGYEELKEAVKEEPHISTEDSIGTALELLSLKRRKMEDDNK